MLQKYRTSTKLFGDFNTLQFGSVMSMVVFVILLIFMTVTPNHHGMSADLPNVSHAIPMPGVLREDVMKVTILRDGKVYFGSDLINIANLPLKIQDRLKDREVERRVYVVADERVRWGTVKQVLGAVRSAGIIRVAFLANQRRNPIVAN